ALNHPGPGGHSPGPARPRPRDEGTRPWASGGPRGVAPQASTARPVMVARMPATISVRELRKAYGKVLAVDGVTFEVEQGEFFGILGPNGAGKTTTLEIIEGLREPDGGEVTVLGKRPWPRDPTLLPLIGVQLQASSFFEQLTAREQLRTFASLYGIGVPRADAMLGVVGLEDQASTRTEKLSGGQAQRAVHRLRPGARPRTAVPGRADGSLGSRGRAEPVGPAAEDQRGRAHGGAAHPSHGRGGAPVQPGRDHGSWQDPQDRPARRADPGAGPAAADHRGIGAAVPRRG